METTKVFGIGLSKTGTTSLFASLHILGFRSGTYRHLKRRSLSKWFQGDFSHDYLFDLDAVTDLPIGALYPQLDVRYPGSKFILTTRNKADWLESCRTFFAPDKINLETSNAFRDSTQLAAYGVISFNRERFSYVYDCHEHGVRNYFRDRPDDLLIMSVVEGDGWESLCPFLKTPIPSVEFPRILPGGFLLPDELRHREQEGGLANWFKRAKKLVTR